MSDHPPLTTRRTFLQRTSAGLGVAALTTLLNGKPHFAPRVKNVIHLFMAGGPSHIDLFDPKPKLKELHGQEMPKSILGEQRVTLMTRDQGAFKTASTAFQFTRHRRSGIEMSELLPHLAKLADELCVVRSLHSEPINHDPAVTFMQTGRPQPGLPCLGSWLSYGLGSANRELPTFVVMLSGPLDQPVPSRYYHSGFLPGQHQGVQFQPGADPVLYLSNPPGVDARARRELIEDVTALNRLRQAQVRDPEIEARINSFELAFRMQTSVPELMDVSKEAAHIKALYGPDVNTAGTFARHCLLARRLVERGVRFVQLFHRGWDHHSNVANRLRKQCLATDQPIAALLSDLKQRGLLEETLVLWGGEFGRTAYSQGDLAGNWGRDHHPRCFTVWMAGGGFKRGYLHGGTDDFGYNVTRDPMHVNDWHATILHQLGLDHTQLTYRFGGRDFRLTDVAGEVVEALLG